MPFKYSIVIQQEHFQIRGFVKNISDERYLNGVFPLNLFHTTTHSFGPSRTLGVEFSYSIF